jgi:ketosteroid isomerase-like protein
MRTIRSAGLALASVALLAGCNSGQQTGQDSKPAGKISNAQAQAIAQATVETWESGDADRIKALYAPTIIGYDSGAPAMSTDRATWDKLQEAFAAAKFDRIDVTKRAIQLLDGDTFVVTHEGTDASSTEPGVTWPFRCTEVFQKAEAGRWLIVNENCSIPPTSG